MARLTSLVEIHRQVTAWTIAAWGIPLGSLILLWTVAGAGPMWAATLVGMCVLGLVCVLGHAIAGFRGDQKTVPAVGLAIACITCLGAGVFVRQVLSNKDGPAVRGGPKVYENRYGRPPAPPSKLSLLTLNVLHGYPDFEKQYQRYSDTVAELKRLDADILVLQEVWRAPEHGHMAEQLGKRLTFHYAYARANGSFDHIGFEEGSAVLSRFPIIQPSRVIMKPRRPWWENRIALFAEIDLPGTASLRLVGVHLSNSESADDQAEYLAKWMREYKPDIIAGDFNALPGSRAVKAISGLGFIEASPTNKSDEPWVDHVFVSGRFHERWAITDASWVIATKAVPGLRDAISDHDGIIVELTRR